MGDAFEEFWSAVPEARVSGPPPLEFSRRVHVLGAIAIAVVLAAGLLAAARHESPVKTATALTAAPVPHLLTVRPVTTTTLATVLPPTTPPPPITAVVSAAATTGNAIDPESASRRLWDAYVQGDRTAATQVAGAAVVETMFSVPYDGGKGVFQGCEPSGDRLFDCREVEDTGRVFDLTAQLDPSGSARIQVITITTEPATTTTTAPPPPSTSAPSTTTTTFPLHG